MKEQVFFEKGTRWRERITEAKGYLGGKIRTVMLMRVIGENGAEDWRVLEEPVAGTPIHTFSRARTRKEANREKAKPVVSSSLRTVLERQEQSGSLNRAGRLLLKYDRRRGGRKPKFKGFPYRGHHTTWIYQESEKLRNQKSRRLTVDGIAMDLTYKAQELGFLEMTEEISVDDIKNARRAYRKKR